MYILGLLTIILAVTDSTYQNKNGNVLITESGKKVPHPEKLDFGKEAGIKFDPKKTEFSKKGHRVPDEGASIFDEIPRRKCSPGKMWIGDKCRAVLGVK